jgi:hypothetical protein
MHKPTEYIAKKDGKNGNKGGCIKMVSIISRKQGTKGGTYT